MQRHLLPKLPRTPDRGMTARYLPASDASEVGGDWYDAFTLADGATALAIGDVVGHDLEAAAGMAQLRNMLRAYARYTDGLVDSPGQALDEGLNRLRRHAASLAHRPLESFTDQLLARARPPDNEDDVALLAVRHVACSPS
jgi:serine phosphatase RsbU (regulator of sigma subunit)